MCMNALSIIAVLIVILLAYGYGSNFFLKTEYYSVPASGQKGGEPVRIVMLADLHGSTFGRGNKRLVGRIREEHPDMICMAGDMTVKNGRGMDSCLDLCRELLGICPVYYAMGNHEIRMEEYEDYCSKLRAAGVFVLDNGHSRCCLRGKMIHVYGWNAEEFFYHKFWQKRSLSVEELNGQLGTPDPGAYGILLAHNPEYFSSYRAWGADLVLSGHVHGGIAIVPFAGGLIDPSLRLFPKYDAGEFRDGSSTMILSRGLGTHHIRFRFFNLPEISVIDIQ